MRSEEIKMDERAYQTPYFVIDEAELSRYFQMLTDSLEKNWNNFKIGYSFKTNSLPWLVSFLKAKGVMAEVVSDDEYALAKKLGFEDWEVVYNGPVKKRDSFERVLLAGGIVNMDGRRELDWLEEGFRLESALILIWRSCVPERLRWARRAEDSVLAMKTAYLRRLWSGSVKFRMWISQDCICIRAVSPAA